MKTRLIRAAGLAAALAFATPLAAQDAPTLADFEIYAAFAKLESNISETTLLVALAALLDEEDADQRAELAEEFEEDAGQVAEYLDFLRAAELTDDQRAVVTAFDGMWAAHVEKGEALIAEPGTAPGHADRLLAFWDELDEIDELVDDKLEKLRERLGASW
jgi:hypothetical protein